MRPALLLGLIFLAALGAWASAPATTDYFFRDYGEALAESRQTGKPIFLDAFTTWCAPCRRMDAEVFTDAEVRRVLEERFVPLRLDMEQPPGLSLGERFQIAAYPTMLVFDEAGELHRAVGFLDVAALIAFARASLDPTANARGQLARYRRGERDTALLRELEARAARANAAVREVYTYDYLLATEDWSSEAASFRLLQGPQTTDTPLFDSLVSRKQQLYRHYAIPVVDERIHGLVDASLFGGTAPVHRASAKTLLRRAYGERADSAYLRFRMREAREAGKAKRFGRFAVKAQKTYPTNDPDELAELIYVFEERLPGYRTESVDAWRERERALRKERGY